MALGDFIADTTNNIPRIFEIKKKLHLLDISTAGVACFNMKIEFTYGEFSRFYYF